MIITAKSAAIPLGEMPLDDSIGYLLWRTLTEIARARLRGGSQDTVRHAATFDLLSLLGSNPGANQSALATALMMDKSNVAAVLKLLEQQQLITRRRSPEDARSQGLFLTPAGVHQLAIMMRAWKRDERQLVMALGPEAALSLTTLLQRTLDIAQTLNRDPAKAPSAQ